ncbi:MAG: two-component sensor histidine kinase [Deltaproteobacteria bacterium]|nr:two-component sensor histidine kinase [Deltaproteobacteria bacterium]
MLKFLFERIKEGMPKNRHYRSLMKSMLMLGFLLPFIPMMLVGGLVFYQFNGAYKTRVQDHLMDAARNGKRHIDRFLNDKTADLRFIATSFGYEKLREAGALEDILRKSRMREGPVFDALVLLDGRGSEIAAARFGKPLGPYRAESSWLGDVLKTGHLIRDIAITPQGISHIVVAVRGGTREAPWVLLAGIDGAAFNDMVKALRVVDTGSAFILSGDGRRLAAAPSGIHPNKSPRPDFQGLPNGGEDVTLFRGRDAAGHETIYAGAFLKPVHWRLVLGHETSAAYVGLNRAKKVTGGFVLLAGLCIAFYAFSLSRKTVRRIELADKEKQKVNEQMLQTGKLASIGELAAGIAHEINNPVAIMVEEAGWIEDLLEEESLQEMENLTELKRALKQIHTQGQRCKAITHQLLSFARKTDFRIQKVNLKALIEDIMAISSRHSKYGRMTIGLDIQEDLPEFMLPSTELQQVLLNLINNAVDAVEEGTGAVAISARLEEPDIVIEVTDNGGGIQKENLSRIFDPFFTTKPVGKGTGLGLSICYGIVKRMGGKIRVNSKPGSGTTFRIRVPAVISGDAPVGLSQGGPDAC